MEDWSDEDFLYSEDRVRDFTEDPKAKIENLVVIGRDLLHENKTHDGFDSIRTFIVFHKTDDEKMFHRKDFVKVDEAYKWIDKNVKKLKR